MTRALLVVALALAGLLAGSPTTWATTLVYPDGTPAAKWQWIADLSRMPIATPTVEVIADDCPGWPGYLERNRINGCANRQRPAIGFRTAGRSASEVRWTVGHELGHLFEQRMAGWVRDEFADATRQAFDPETFADTYATCSIYRRPWQAGESWGGYVGTVRDWGRVCAAIRADGARMEN